MIGRVVAALIGFAVFIGGAVSAQPQTPPVSAAGRPIVLAIHGGGGVRDRAEMTPEIEAAYRADLTRSLQAGYAILNAGGTSVAAVEAAIRVMEDSPLFNAGKGASYTAAGTHQLDSAIMEGRTLKAGAVSIVEGVKNPITLARAVMEKSPHVMLSAQGAAQFARENGIEMRPPFYFHTDRKWESLQRRLRDQRPFGERQETDTGAAPASRADPIARPRSEASDTAAFGTVGAVALDRNGDLAAGTSTGGREGKLVGRVGDSPIIGAGTYANNATLAVSSTGLGEYVMRLVAAKDMSDLMEYRGLSLAVATRTVNDKIVKMGGGVGVVALDAQGNVAMPFSGDGMYRGVVRGDGRPVIQIYRE